MFRGLSGVPPNSALMSLVLPVVWAASVGAQVDDPANENPVLEEVVVVATLREIPLQDLPLSVGVKTGKDLREIGAVSIDDVWRQVPNLAVRDAPFGGRSFIIRGLIDTDTFLSTEPINAFYIDDTPITYINGLFYTPANVALLDLEGLEVVRGPQGTLVGANAMGGVVRFITNEPNPEAPSAYLETNFSQTSHGGLNYGGNAMWNQPTGANSALRFAALYQDNDGYIDDVGLGRTDINSEQRTAGRVSWLWNISDQWEILARVYAEDIETGGYNYADDVGRPWTGQLTEGSYQIVTSFPEPRDEEVQISSLRLRWRGDDTEFHSSTSFYKKDVSLIIDWTVEHWFFLGVDNPAFSGNVTTQEDFTQEFRFNSTGGGRFNWLLGAYYLDLDDTLYEFLYSENLPMDFLGVPAGGTIVYVDSNRVTKREDMALFGEVSWRFADSLEGTVGLRWYDSERSQSVSPGGFFIIPGMAEGQSDGIVPKASLSWKINDQTMVYGQVARGYRPGQFNGPGATGLCGARPVIGDDELTNYELGVKHGSSDGSAIINLSVFHIDWEDMQFNAFDDDCPFPILENVGEASSQGFELDFTWLISEGFRLQGGVGYTNAQLDSEFIGSTANIPAGTAIPNVPEWTANINGAWEFEWHREWPGHLRADVQYVDERATLFDETIDFPKYRKIDAYAIAGLRVGAGHGAFMAELFINNLFDERAEMFCCRNFFDPAINRPRTVGVRGSWSF